MTTSNEATPDADADADADAVATARNSTTTSSPEPTTTTTTTTRPNTTSSTTETSIDKITTNRALSSSIWVQVSEQLPSLQECHDFCTNTKNDSNGASSSSCGAVCSFVGITRDNFQGKRVQHLSYEAYVPMAEKVLYNLCHEAITKDWNDNKNDADQNNNIQDIDHSIHRIVAVHKIGDCPVGQASVILYCASPHRRASLECISFLIEQLKAKVPIWKREVYYPDESGNDHDATASSCSVWKENIEWQEGKPKRVMKKEQVEEKGC